MAPDIIDSFLSTSPVIPRENLPAEMKALADELAQMGNQEKTLRFAYETLAQKFRGYRVLTFLRLDRLLITNIATLWSIRGFLHCHQINYLLRTLLIASGQFQEGDIETCWTHIWFISPHQYLIVTLRNGQKIEVDLWARAYGVPFGQHAHGFQGGSFFATIEQ